MPWPTTVGRGIASLLSRKGTKAAQKAVSPKTQLRNVQSAKIMAQANNRLKKYYSDAFNKSRARINEMKMPAANKDAAVEKLRTFMRNRHSKEMMRTASGRTYDIPPPVTPISELVREGLAFALGGGAGYGIAKNEEAIIDMLKSTKLPTGIDIETTSIGDLMGGGTGKDFSILGNKGFAGRDMSEVAGALLDQDDLFPTEYDEPDREPGLEEGSIGDLLFFNRILGD